jgi:hypothetical protein
VRRTAKYLNENSKSCSGPEVVGQIHDDGLRSAANNNPLKGLFGGRIDLLMRKPGGDIEKVPGVRCLVQLPPLSPANVGRAAEDIDDCVLLPVMMDSSASTRFDSE